MVTLACITKELTVMGTVGQSFPYRNRACKTQYCEMHSKKAQVKMRSSRISPPGQLLLWLSILGDDATRSTITCVSVDRHS